MTRIYNNLFVNFDLNESFVIYGDREDNPLCWMIVFVIIVIVIVIEKYISFSDIIAIAFIDIISIVSLF